ncbi:MAG: lytic transglycosylase domain-containing protein [Caulobacterales bacterium]
MPKGQSKATRPSSARNQSADAPGWRRPLLVCAAIMVLAVSVAAFTQESRENATPTGLVSAAAASEYIAPALPPATELGRLQAGIAAADGGRWAELDTIRANVSDPLVQKILQWRRAADANAPEDFELARTALQDLTGWPGRVTMRERLERQAFNAGISSAQLVELLTQDGGPISGDGRIALAVAYQNLGRTSEATELARRAWREDRLSSRAAAVARSSFGASFTGSDHQTRVDMLLWRGERTEARALFPEIGAADRLLAEARIALQTRPRRGLQAAVDRVPASRQDDPGFLYERARYIRTSGRLEDAARFAARIDAAAAPAIARDDIFREKRAYLNNALRSGDGRRAYAFAQSHAMTSGESFADAEFLSGWLALRYLRDANLAKRHFETLANGVSSPISLARGYYWLGQANDALNDTAAKQAALSRAAQYDYAYYGQLAAVELNANAAISLTELGTIPQEARRRFDARELVQVLRLMESMGDQQDFERVAFYLDDTINDPHELELLAEMARRNNYAKSALRSAKAGLFRGVVAPNAAYPLIELPSAARQPGRPEAALVYAIIRQESEFDTNARSRAGALGLMQLMPATAQLTARREGIAYVRSNLTADPAYNMNLGSRHLQDLLDEWNGSYVLTIASYNAGSGRAREWIAAFGDPRARGVDVVDWVELIPFSETRNYVQRVMENLQVYRNRISAEPAPIRIREDLRRGS